MAEEVYESDLINMVIGTHMSIAGGIAKTAENVVKMEANTMQIFSRNPRGSNYKTYTSEEIEKFQSIRMEHWTDSCPCAIYYESGKRNGENL